MHLYLGTARSLGDHGTESPTWYSPYMSPHLSPSIDMNSCHVVVLGLNHCPGNWAADAFMESIRGQIDPAYFVFSPTSCESIRYCIHIILVSTWILNDNQEEPVGFRMVLCKDKKIKWKRGEDVNHFTCKVLLHSTQGQSTPSCWKWPGNSEENIRIH